MSHLSVKDESAINTKVLYKVTLPLPQKLNTGIHSSNMLDILNTCLRHYNGSNTPSYNILQLTKTEYPFCKRHRSRNRVADEGDIRCHLILYILQRSRTVHTEVGEVAEMVMALG